MEAQGKGSRMIFQGTNFAPEFREESSLGPHLCDIIQKHLLTRVRECIQKISSSVFPLSKQNAFPQQSITVKVSLRSSSFQVFLTPGMQWRYFYPAWSISGPQSKWACRCAEPACTKYWIIISSFTHLSKAT